MTYGASNYQLSNKNMYPSFIRTMPNNKALIDVIIHIIKWFRWNWVAFIGSQDDYSQDGLYLFSQSAKMNNICLAYQYLIGQSSNYISILSRIEKCNIKVIVVFSSVEVAKNVIRAAIKNNITNKVWIASEVWSMSKQLLNEPGIQNIGEIFGISEKLLSFPGFEQFMYKKQSKSNDEYLKDGEIHPPQPVRKMCNQECHNCSSLSPKEILNEDPTFSFPIYAAIYTMAKALHKVLHCDANGCNKNITVYPFMVKPLYIKISIFIIYAENIFFFGKCAQTFLSDILQLLKEIKQVDFLLHGRKVKYDQNGDLPVFYDVIFWRLETSPPVFERIGTYYSYPEIAFTINNSLIGWDNDASVSSTLIHHSRGYITILNMY